MQRTALIISPNWKDYAETYLADCLASLEKQTVRDWDLFLIDNETSEASFALLQRLAPGARIIRLETNEGFAGGNNAALRAAIREGYEDAFLLNMDTVAEPDCLKKLRAAAEDHPEAGAIQARLMLWPDTARINSLGNLTHFLGFGFSDGYRESMMNRSLAVREIAYPSGAAVLLNLRALAAVGLFDEEMWMYNEDQDLGWRLWVAGFACLLAPEAVVYHKYEFSRSIKKYYWMDRNRIIAMIKNYRLATLVAIAPAFAVMEAGLILFSLKSGWFKEKMRVWKYFFSSRAWKKLIASRRTTQRLRARTDRQVTRLFSGRIWYQEIDDVKLRLINPVFELYWKLVRLIMWW